MNVCLKLIQSQCFPMLTYGICANSLTAIDVNKLSFAYNSVFCKLFNTHCVQTIQYCQYFCGHWKFEFHLDFQRYCFLRKLYLSDKLRPNLQLNKCDLNDMMLIAEKYGLSILDSAGLIKFKIWTYFRNELGL